MIQKMKDNVEVVIFIGGLLFILILGVALFGVEKREVKKYNNGFCIECGKAYNEVDYFEKADGTNERHFSCEKCDISGTIKISNVE